MSNSLPLFICVCLIALPILIPVKGDADEVDVTAVYRVAVDQDYAPYEFMDLDGKIKGFTPDLLRAIGEQAGVTFVFTPMDWPDAVAALDDGRIDLVNMIRTPQRQGRYRFSEPHSHIEQAIFRHVSAHGVSDLESLAGHRVALQRHDISSEMLAARTDFERVPVQDKAEGFLLLNAGKVDAFLAADQAGLRLIREYDLGEVEVAALGLFPQDFCFAASAGNQKLIDLLNAGLKQAKASDSYDEIVDRWFTPGLPEHSWLVHYRYAVVGFVGALAAVLVGFVVWNITLRRAVELRTKALNESRDSLNEAQRIARIGSWEWDIDSDTLLWSDESFRIFGIDRQEFGANFDAFIEAVHPDDRQRVRESVNRAVRDREPEWTIDYRIIRPEGELRYLHEKARAIFAPDGRVAKRLGTVQDVTERKRAEEALQASEEQYRTLIQKIRAAVVVHGSDTRILACNPMAEELLGLTENQMLGKEAIDPGWRFSGEDGTPMPPAEYPVNQVLASGQPLRNLVVGVHRPGSDEDVWVLVSADPVRLDGKQIDSVIVTFIDITERRQAEKALHESEKRVRRKLDAILSPEADIGSLELSDIIDSDRIQKLMDEFYRLTNVGIGIIDLHGNVLVGTGWQDICTEFHRKNPDSCRRCIESDLELSSNVPAGTFKKYRCKNNMWDIATPIMLADKHVGNIFLGQFLFDDEAPEYETFRRQAHKYGFDEEDYLAALDRVPRWSHEKVEAAMSFYAAFAEMIGNLSYSNIRLASALEERKRTEEALRGSKKRFEDLFNRAAVPLCLVNKDGAKLEFNERFRTTFGYSREELPTLTEWWLLAYPDPAYREEVLSVCEAALQKAVATDSDLEPIEYHVTCKNGDVRTMVVWGGAIGGDFLLTFFDVTERKRAEEKLTRLAAIVESSDDAIIGKTLDGIITSWNAGAERMYGYPENEVLGKHISILAPPDRVTEIAEILEGLKSGEHTEHLETLRRRRDGAVIHVSLTVSPVFDGEGRIVAASAIARDITERKQIEQERQANAHFLESMDRVNRAIQASSDLEQMMRDVLDVVLSIFDCDRAWLVYPCDPNASTWQVPMERTKPEYPGAHALGVEIPMDEGVREAHRTQLASDGPVRYGPGTENPLPADDSERFGYKCFMSMAIHPKIGSPWQFGMHQCSYARVWTPEEEQLFEAIGRRLSDALTSLLSHRDLRESEGRFRALVEQAADAFYLLDHEGGILDVNQSACDGLGYRRDELLTLNVADVDVEVVEHRHRERFWDALRPGEPATFEGLHRRKDGSTFPVEVRLGVLELGGQRLMLGLARDITERKHAEEELRRAETEVRELNLELERRVRERTEELRSLLDSTPDMILKTDLNLRIIWANRTAMDMNRECVGMTCYHAFPGRDQVCEGCPVAKALKTKRIERGVMHQPVSDTAPDEQYWENIGVPQLDENGEVVACIEISRNITDRMQSTRRLEAANQELEAFSYSVSHDLRAPLRHLTGFVNLIAKRATEGLDEKNMHYLSVIADSATEMGKLIDDILSFSRMGRVSMTMTRVSMEDLVKDVLQMLQQDVEGRDISWSIGALPEVYGSQEMLRTVMTNLVSNAIKFSAQRSQAIIEIGHTLGEDDQNVFFVRDNGTGFDMRYADKLFNLFERLHRAEEFEGTGLGLANVRRIIERHGGRTWAEGAVREGATFYFSLPRNMGG